MSACSWFHIVETRHVAGVLGAPESLYEDIIKDLGSNVRRVSPAREGKLQAVEARVEELESTRPKLKCTRMR